MPGLPSACPPGFIIRKILPGSWFMVSTIICVGLGQLIETCYRVALEINCGTGPISFFIDRAEHPANPGLVSGHTAIALFWARAYLLIQTETQKSACTPCYLPWWLFPGSLFIGPGGRH